MKDQRENTKKHGKITFVAVDTSCVECGSPYASKKLIGQDEVWICESCDREKIKGAKNETK